MKLIPGLLALESCKDTCKINKSIKINQSSKQNIVKSNKTLIIKVISVIVIACLIERSIDFSKN